MSDETDLDPSPVFFTSKHGKLSEQVTKIHEQTRAALPSISSDSETDDDGEVKVVHLRRVDHTDAGATVRRGPLSDADVESHRKIPAELTLSGARASIERPRTHVSRTMSTDTIEYAVEIY